MKLLITGANGFIGSHLVNRLSNKYKIRVLIRKPIKYIKNKNIELFYGDLTNPSSLKGIANGVDVVYHLASLRPNKTHSYKQYWDVNLKGTKNLLEECKGRVNRFIFASAADVCGNSIFSEPISESCPYNPKSIYEKTKCEAEKEVLNYSDKIDIVIARLSFAYGPGNLSMLEMFKLIKKNRFWIMGDGNNLLQPTYIDDLINGFSLLLNKKKLSSKIYNLIGEEIISFTDFFELIADELCVNKPNKKIPHLLIGPLSSFFRFKNVILKKGNLRLGVLDYFMTNHVHDISKAEKELGYKPKVGLKEGIKNTIEWYKAMKLL